MVQHKNAPQPGTHRYELMQHAEATLGSGNLREAVRLPEGEDLNEWLAVNSSAGCQRHLIFLFTFQLSTFSTKLICSMAQLLNFAPQNHVQLCPLDHGLQFHYKDRLLRIDLQL